jgi:glycosyltransferase involved in cell wall biosynthesis
MREMPQHADPFTVQVLFPNFYNEFGVSYTVKSVLEGIAVDGISAGVTASATDVKARYVHGVTNKYLYRYVIPHFRSPMLSVFRAARRRLRAGDIAYFWLESPADMCEYFRARNVLVVREMINCTLQLRRRELRKAYAALGEPDLSGISDNMIEKERRDLLSADLICCPNPFVKRSVVDYGFSADRCIDTSYGWSANRLGTEGRVPSNPSIFTAAFVGTIDVRKGAPVLLEAWVKSAVKGRLLLAGQMSPEVRQKFAEVLQRPDIVQLGFMRDVGSVYRSADVFCLPTWEEGGPQVTLEAMSVGAVPIVTPMGTAGAFSAEDGVGIVIPPGDVAALSDALRLLANDSSKLKSLKQQARERASQYTWELVGRRRRTALIRHRDQWLTSRSSART